MSVDGKLNDPQPRPRTLFKESRIERKASRLARTKSFWSLSFEEKNKRKHSTTEKVKLTHLLKSNQNEQTAKLNTKHQQECDLLEDVKNFVKLKADIEKEYGTALLKLVSRFQKKEISSTPSGDQKNVPALSSWKSILDTTEKVANAHVACSDKYKNEVYENLKDCKVNKEGTLKKSQDVLAALQMEVSESVRYLVKRKKEYFDIEHLTQVSLEKMNETKTRLQKNNTGLFKSKGDLEKTYQKLQQKYEENKKKSTICRNSYLFTIASANAHQKRYFESDIPEVIRILDGEVYDNLRDSMTTICETELKVAETTNNLYLESSNKASKVLREYDSSLFIRNHSVFEWGVAYTFERCGKDSNSGILQSESRDDDNSLNREARKSSFSVVTQNRILKGLKSRIDSLQKHIKENKLKPSNEDGTSKSQAGSDENLEIRLRKCLEDLRKTETVITCAEARLDLLRKSEVDVERWLKSAENQVENENRNMKRNSIKHQQTSSTTNFTSDEDEDSFIGEDFWDDEPFDDELDVSENKITKHKTLLSTSIYDSISLPSSDRSRTYPVACVVSYAYEATRTDELTIKVGDTLEVVEDGDLDQWVKARNVEGRVGYVPEYYLDFSSHVDRGTSPQHNYSEPPGENYMDTLGSSGSTTSGTSSLTARSMTSAESSNQNPLLARALYLYEALDDEQLSFPEGAIISVLEKDDNGVDDGWWKGELNGQVGVFPSIVVEELGTNHRDSDHPSTPTFIPNPPSFIPQQLPQTTRSYKS